MVLDLESRAAMDLGFRGSREDSLSNVVEHSWRLEPRALCNRASTFHDGLPFCCWKSLNAAYGMTVLSAAISLLLSKTWDGGGTKF